MHYEVILAYRQSIVKSLKRLVNLLSYKTALLICLSKKREKRSYVRLSLIEREYRLPYCHNTSFCLCIELLSLFNAKLKLIAYRRAYRLARCLLLSRAGLRVRLCAYSQVPSNRRLCLASNNVRCTALHANTLRNRFRVTVCPSPFSRSTL